MFVSLLRKGFYLLCALMLFGFSSTNTEFISFGAFFIKYLPKPIIVNGRNKSIINIKIQNPIVNLLYYNSRFFRNSGSTSCSIIFNQFLSKTFLSSKDPLRSKYCCHSACDAQHNIQHRTPFCPLFYQLTGFKCERGKCRKTST